jgi:hypothetical protein
MTHTIPAPRPTGEHLAAPQVRESICAALGRRWLCKATTAHRIIYSERAPVQRVVDHIEVLKARGDFAAIAQLVAPIEEAMAAVHTAKQLADAIPAQRFADLAEDRAVEEYRMRPCKETAEALLRASARQDLATEQRDAALRAEHGL